MIERSEFASWRNGQIYDEFRKTVQEKMSSIANTILTRQEPNGNADMYIRGALAAFTEVLEWEPVYADAPEGDNEEV